ELSAEIEMAYDLVCCPVGTGGTLAGLAYGLPAGRRALGFAVLKGGFLTAEVARLQIMTYGRQSANWSVDPDFHHGGYARRTAELDAFIADFAGRHGLRLDRVYAAKMMYGLTTLAARGAFPPGTRIIAVLTSPTQVDRSG